MDAKNKRVLWLELTGFIFTVIAGTVMHFGFELTGFNRGLAWLFPINESPWEHLKLSFYPVMLWGLIEFAILQRSMFLRPADSGSVRTFWFVRLLGAYVATMTTVISWSLQHRLIGRSFLPIDIAMMYAGLLASALLCWRLITRPPLRHPRLVGRCTVAGLACMLAGFMLFSYRVPISLLWLDGPCQAFGIIEYHILFNRQLPTHCPDPATVGSLPGLCGFVPLALAGCLLAVCLAAGRRRKPA